MKNVHPKTFRFVFVQVLLFFVLFFSFSTNSIAQIANLKFASAQASYSELPAGSNLIPGGSGIGAASAVTPIGFDFVFQGNTYSSFSVNAAGLLKLGSVAVTTESANNASSITNTPKLYAWWDATATMAAANGGGVTFALTGSAPNRVLTVQWRVAYTTSSSTGFSYQVKLYETTNVIEYLYGTALPAGTLSASVGLGNFGANEYQSFYTFNNIPSSTLNYNANTIFPGAGAGFKYTFTPSFASLSPANLANKPSFWLKADGDFNATRTFLNVPAGRRTASSELNTTWAASNSVLSATNAWIASAAQGASGTPTGSNQLAALTLDLGSIQTIHGVATLGAGSNAYYVKDYMVRVSNDNVTYTDLGLFMGNEINTALRFADFDTPVSCRYVRIIPSGFEIYRALRADVYTKSSASIPNNTRVSNWEDNSGNQWHAYQNTVASQPSFNSNQINFNPAVNFTNSPGTSLNFPDLANIRQSYWVAQDATAAGNTYFHVLFGASDVNIYGPAAFPRFHGGLAGAVQFLPSMLATQGSWRKDGTLGSAASLYDFGPQGEPNLMTSWSLLDDSPFHAQTISFQSGLNRSWQGPIAEIITFQNQVNTNQQNIVETYLGIKYGISVGHDYVTPDGTIVWNRTANSTYHNNVFGLGRSDSQGLHQRQSFSTSFTGRFITLGNNSLIGATNAASVGNSLASDNSYLLLGDNNAPILYEETLTGDYYPLLRKWKVSNTGVPAATKISVPAFGNSSPNALPYSNIERFDAETVYLVLDTDGDGNFSNASYTAMTKVGTGVNATWEINQVLPNNAVIGFAVKQNLTDTDGDSVLDAIDIDDDNDGAIDALEQIDCKTFGRDLRYVNMTGAAIASKSDNTINTNTTADNATWISSYSTETYTLPLSLKFRREANSGQAMVGLIPVANTQTPNNYTDNGYKFYLLGTNAYGYFGATWNFTHTSLPDEEYSIDISATGFVTVRINGVQRHTFQGANSAYRFVVSSSAATIALKDIRLTNTTYPERTVCMDRDTDGDGVANRLELDSDNDGCSDAIEAGTVTNLSATTVAAPYGTNGLANSLETVADNGIYNRTVNYYNARIAAIKACSDSDGDSVADLVDVDDDNDGITDAQECIPFNINNLNYAPQTFSVTNGASASQTFPAAPDGLVVNVWTLDNSFNVRINGVPLVNPQELEFWSTTRNNAIFEFLDGTSHTAIWEVVGNQSRPIIRVHIDKFGVVKVFGSRTSGGALEEMRLRNGSFNEILLNTNSTNTFQIGQLVVAQTFITGDYGVLIPPNCDADNDGIPNGLDLDSDGDGCPDAREAGVTGTLNSGTIRNLVNGTLTSTPSVNFAIANAPFGANGLADGLESNENGLTSYPSSYLNFALNPVINACLDTDSDGMPDAFDIDDDNDGVLDLLEQADCVFTGKDITTIPFSGTGVTARTSSTITSSNTNNWLSSYSNENFTLPISLKFKRPTSRNSAMIGLVPSINNLTPTTWTDNGYKFYFELGNVNGYFGSSWNFTQATVPDEEYSIDISATGFVTVRINGVQVRAFQGANTTYKLAVSGLTTMQFTDVRLTNMANPEIMTCPDMDNDGRPNYLDLDSDGDGCSDAIEAGSSTTLSSTSVFPTGTDTNNNGLLNDYEGNTAGTINYISYYTEYAIVNSINTCSDTDSDGVRDIVDLDDDNDGVLDATEMTCASTLLPFDGVTISKPNAINYTFNGTFTLNNLIDGVDNNVFVLRSPTGTLNGEWFRIALPSLKILNYVEIGHYSGQTLFTVGSTYRVEGSLDGINWTNVSGTLTYNNQNKSVNNRYSTYNSNAAAFNNNTAYFYYRLVGINATSGGTWATELYFNQRECTDLDTDEDGIPNRLELDSDGDGCSDAKEAGATASLASNFVFTGSFGNNGFVNSLETASESGIFNGTYTYNYAANPQINACLDNDSDGVIDFFDIDDDNDGALDVTETSCTLYAYTGSNTSITVPVGAVSMEVKMWGAGGGGSNTNNSTAGSGAFVFGKLNVTPNETFTLIVGQGGVNKSPVATFGGGGAGGNDPFQALHGGSGGGRSELRRGSTSLLIAGGGGGAAGSPTIVSYAGGAGIRLGQDGVPNSQAPNGAGKGGTQSAGGLGGTLTGETGFNGANGAQYLGGNGGASKQANAGAGGGGGGGWYGGGGGAGMGIEPFQESSAGGGSSYFSGTLLQKLGIAGNTNSTGGTLTAAPNNTDPAYIAGVGTGGAANSAGGNGLIQICYTLDTDGDGIVNQFDLDSDADGCSDAFEAGSVALPSSTSSFPTGTDSNGNGLLNTYEGTTAGTIKYVSRYSLFALSNLNSACIDSDTDGVPDLNDLDDDNDGILDTNEQTNCITSGIDLTTLTFNGSAITARTASTITGAGGGVWRSSYSDQNLKLPISLKFKHNTTGVEMFGLIPVGTAQNQATWQDGSYKIYPSYGNAYGYFTTTWDFGPVAITSNDVLSIDISSTGFVTAAVNGVTQRAFQGTVSDYKLTLSSNIASSLTDIILTDLTRPANFACTDIDTDADGIPNRLDLDSDGDNCPDAREAGVIGTLTSGSVTNRVNGNNVTSSVASSIVSATYGDNGFANSIETNTESGLYSGTYTYFFASDANVSTCRDTDSDGVSDIVDIDDDNDGILDSIECPLTNILVNGEFTGNTTGWTGSANWAYNSGGFIWNSTDNVTNNVISQNFARPTFNPESSNVDIAFDVNTNGTGYLITSTGTATMDVVLNNTIYATLTNPSGGTTASVVARNGAAVNVSSINIVNTNVPSTRIIVSVPRTLFNTTNTLGFSFTATTDDFGIDNVFIGTQTNSCDTDSDGRINSKDLDSDGDGCFDAVEAGTTYVSNAVASSAKLTTNVIPGNYGTNGFADGLETTTDAGIYTGSYTYSFALDANGKACLDTDSDGVADVYDLDDDNDGVLDTVECPLTNILVNGSFTGGTTGWTANANWAYNVGGFVWNAADNVSNNVISQTFARPVFDAESNMQDISFDFNTNGFGWLVTSSGTATLDVSINNVIYATITNPSGGTTASIVGRNGATVNRSSANIVTDNIPNTRIVFRVPNSIFNSSNTIAFSFSATNDDIGIDNVFVGTRINTCDTDTDGIVNSKDLDSDADGCFDAVEAKTATSLTQSTIAAPYGNNGFANSLETSSESGSYSGTYTYDRAIDASIKACLDTDFDGVADIDDVDDDNDGILDATECPTAPLNTNESNGTFGTAAAPRNVSNTNVTGGYVYASSNTAGAQYAVINQSTPYHPSASFWRYVGKTTGAANDAYLAVNGSTTVGIFYAETVNLQATVKYRISFWHQAASTANDYALAAELVSSSNTILATASTGPQNSLGWKLTTIEYTSPTNQTVSFRLKNTSVNLNGNDFSIDDISITPVGCPDSDGDGIPNHLDLDSDGDGCSDANEVYASATAQGNDGNQYFGTGTPPAVDASGKVTGASYTANNPNVLTVGRATVITTQPADVTTVPGATNISYSATVTPGSGTTTYQWQVSTNGGGTWTNISNNATYSGATTATLTISTATITMKDYRYRLNISQSDYICGNLSTSAARLIMNNTPTVTDDVATATEDTPLNGTVLTNDSGSGGSAITVTNFTINGTTFTAGQTASIPNVGTIILRANGTYTFTPAANYNGTVPLVSYTATDANGGSDTGDLTISITPVNDPVVVVNETVSTNQGVAATGNVLSNDTDADGNSLSVLQFTVSGVTYNVGTNVSIPGKGTITVAANGAYTFTPIATYSGAVPVIGYTVSDGNGSSVDGTLTITVIDVNDPPVAADDITTTLQNTPVSGNVLTNDSDPESNTLSITKITIAGVDYPAGTTATIANVGTVVVNANGTYTFTPTSTFTGAAPVITYTLSDGTATSTAALKVAVTAVVNANPVAAVDTKTTTEDTPATGNVLSNDTDAEGNTLSVTSFTIGGLSHPAGTTATISGVGTMVVNSNGTYTFTPLANYAGSVPVINYAISDGNGGTASSTLTITITPVNDAPLATDDVAMVTEDTPKTGNVLTNDSDIENNTLSITQFVISGTTYPAGSTATIAGVGTLVINANGSYTFTPEANYTGAIPVATYTVSDGNGGTDTGDLAFSMVAVNDAPVASDDTATTPQGTTKTGDIVTIADTDADGNTLSLTQFKINGITHSAGSTANIPGVGTLQINADGTYTFIPLPAYVGTVPTVEYTISDGNGGTDTGNFVITVTDVNDPPAAARDEKTVNRNSPAIGSLLSNDSDADNHPLSITQFVINGVTTIVDPTNGGTYTLAGVGTFVISANGNYTFTPLNSYTGTTPALTYTVSDGTATATSTLTVYVEPFNTAPVAMADSRTINEDGVATDNVLSNDTDAESDALSVTQFTIGTQIYPAGTTATIPNVGTLVINSNGTYTFTPLANYHGTVPTISYLVTDSAGATATGQLSITVTAVNDAPVALDDQASTLEDTLLSGNVRSNDSDVDGNTTVITQFTVGGQTYTAGQTANISGVGTLQLNADGSYTLTPAANYNGAFSAVTYTISDGNGGTATANLSINITPVNDAPVASNDTDTTPQGTTKSGDILTVADTDVDGNTLSLTQFAIGGVTYPAGTTATIAGVGTLVVNTDGTYTFTPISTYVGTVPTVTYTLSDGNGGTSNGTFILTVSDLPEPPVATDDFATVGKNTVVSGNLLSNDSDPESNTLTIASYSIHGVTGPFTLGSTVTIPSVGTMRVNANGTFTFTPLPTYAGTVPAITYTVSDGHGGTDTGLLSITVLDTNTPPTATNDPVTATEDTPRTGNVLTNDSDSNGDSISLVSFVVGSTTYPAGATATIPNVGTITLAADGAFTFTPFANYNGTVPAINYSITDGLGGVATAALNITVTSVNDNPIAVNDDNISGSEDSPITGNVLANDSDPDGTPISVSQFSISGVSGTFTAGQTATIPGRGSLQINADGTFTFTPLPNYFGSVPLITYTAQDINGGTATATLGLSVTPVNDPPVVVNDVIAVAEGSTGTGNVLTNDSDLESGTLAVTQFTINGTIYTPGSIVTIPNVGIVVLNADGSYSFTGAPNFSGSVPVINYTATDGTGGLSTGTLTVTLQNVNDAPVVVSETVITPEDTPATGNVLANDTDPEGTALTISQFVVGGVTYNAGQTVTLAGIGTINIAANGAYVFTPVANYFGTVPPVIYQVSDGQTTTSGSLTISINAVNDAPVAVNDTKVGEVNANVNGNVISNDTDVENASLAVVNFIISGTTYTAGQTATIPNVGTLTITADGTYTFVPALNYAGTLPVITYNISDGAGGTASATLALSITFDTDGDGIPDAVEKGPGIAPDTDGDGIPDYKDLDSDNDGILDSVENAACVPAVMPCDIDGDGMPNYLDLDSDGDGISDVMEAGGADANADGKVDGAIDVQGIPTAANGGLTPPNTDGTAGTNPYDTDSDGDGISDSVEGTRDTDGDGTPDYRDVDSDGDGISDAIEGSADADGDGTPNFRDFDSDGDGILDATEGIVDTDTDGRPNFLDTDSDADGIPDSVEGSTDTDGDGTPDFRDLDSDGDGIPDSVEGITDTDGDGIPNYKDTDSDGDGISDSDEKGLNPLSPRDTDGDGNPDYKDLDSDGDGIPDSVEGILDTDGDGLPNYLDPDSDGDGIPDSVEKGINPLVPLDTDGDGTPDYLDTDSDNDGITDAIEKGPNPAQPLDTDGDGVPDYRDSDSDNDGISDFTEGTSDTDGDGTPNYRDLDSDADGKPDQQEGVGDPDNDTITNYLDPDSDNDGVLDSVDQCPLVAGNLASGCPLDSDNDGVPDTADFDDDNDGILDSVEDAACAPTSPSCDTDGDGIPNNLDPDSDNDGISDVRESNGVDVNGDGIVDGAVDSNGVPTSANGGISPPNTDGTGGLNPYDTDSDGDGIPDSIEKGSNGNAPLDSDGDGTPNYLDTDSDGDGIPDSMERGTGTAIVDTDGDGTPNYLDLDSDGDGITDAVEKGPNGATPLDTDGDGVPNFRDVDSDGDGIPDSIEGTTDTDTDGTPNYLDLDSDGDGISDSIEKEPNPLAPIDTDGDGTPDYRDLDTDGDGISDAMEGVIDTDSDGIPNYRDLDSDGDGILDATEGTVDTDNDGTPNYKDLDSDADGISDATEGNLDSDGDGTANFLDLDSDGDGISDVTEGTRDTDGDGTPDYLDLDSDGDGISDNIEKGPTATPLDSDGDGIPNYRDLDSDGDGISDAIEGTVNTDGDTIPNYLDTDSDGDGVPDSTEGNVDSDRDGSPDYLDLDSDGDSVLDATDLCRVTVGEPSLNGCPTDFDGDGIVDASDLDDDNDGILDSIENAACNPSSVNCDTDGDGIPNRFDLDSDGDGIRDVREANGLDVNADGIVDGAVDANGIPVAANSGLTPPNTDGTGGLNPYDTDSDGDGIPDSAEKGTNGNIPRDTDGDGTPDYLDLDSDNDGILDSVEGNVDTDGDAIPNYRDLDSDADGVLDATEVVDGTSPTNACSLIPVHQTIASPAWATGDCDGDGNPNSSDPHLNAPTAQNDNFVISGSGAQQFNILSNDDFLAGSGITINRLAGSSGGTALGTVSFNANTGMMTYTPAAGEISGVKTVVYQVCKGIVCATATANLNFCDTNNPSLDCDGDGVTNGREAIDGTNPVDACSLIRSSQTLTPSSSWLAGDCDGDGNPNSSDPNITTAVAMNDLLQIAGTGAQTFNILANDDFLPGRSTITRLSGVNGGTAQGIISFNNATGELTYTPAVGETTGTRTINYQVCNNAVCATATITLSFCNPNDPSADCDGDGVTNGQEAIDGTNPNDACSLKFRSQTLIPSAAWLAADCDGDGVTNGVERTDRTDPTDACSLLMTSQILANASAAWLAADCDGDGNPNGTDDAPLDFCIDGAGQVPVYGSLAYQFFMDEDCDDDGIVNGLECHNGGLACEDTDGDGTPNYLDRDSDNDGILDYTESNIDSDGDRIPDYVDVDSDNDGILDIRESAGDSDGDGIPNYLDLDVDGDGILDSFEALTKFRNQVDSNNNGRVDCTTDLNGNGLMDCVETSMGGKSCEIPDTDGDGIPDFLDLDSDNDGILDRIELRGDMDGDELPNYRDLDSDGDRIGDAVEGAQDQDADGTPNFLDVDSDGDGILDRFEGPLNCVNCTDRVDNNEDGWDDRNQFSTAGWTVDTDGDGNPDYLDLDSDNDGISDKIEAGKDPKIPADTDGDGIPDFRDLDSDNDGILDKIEGTLDTDGDGIPNFLDLDSDNDGIPDAVEGTTDTDGDGIPNYLDTDSDSDGIPDSVEAGKDPKNPVDTDGDGKPDYTDVDSDNDGIPDALEAGKDPKKPVDTDKDGIPDYQDSDSDNDGIPDAVEAGKDPKNPMDTDKDGVPDYLDLDSDNDGITDAVEAGKDPINPVDTDKDGTPDYRDLDSDNDGIPDSVEGAIDTDKDGIFDFRDLDSDNDGISDADEAGRDTKRPVDTDGDGTPDYRDLDSDNDGIPDAIEGKRDTDSDGVPDYLDLDSDNDGYSDKHEAGANPANPVDTDKDGLPDYRDLDSDADGITDALEDDLNYGALPDCDKDGIENRIDPDQCDTFTPQGISPNGDGQNDVLIIPGILRMGNNTITIYNRWGNVVYQKDNYQNDWGGQTDRAFSLMSEDNLLPDGTYYYVIDFKGKYPEIGQYVYINRLEK